MVEGDDSSKKKKKKKISPAQRRVELAFACELFSSVSAPFRLPAYWMLLPTFRANLPHSAC
jgi:hypothetical protein